MRLTTEFLRREEQIKRQDRIWQIVMCVTLVVTLGLVVVFIKEML